MANFVRDYLKDHPEHAALPVYKRAQHSIHFQNPDKSVTAIFSGSPMHFEESKGVWKALDTALVYDKKTDDYGAPGLRPRLKIDRTNTVGVYSQKTVQVGLLAASATSVGFEAKTQFPTAKVDDDSIVSVDGNIEHRVRLTETGLRETLTLFKPPDIVDTKADDWYVIDTIVDGHTFVDGEITEDFSKEGYQFPQPHAKDDKGNEAPCKRWAKTDGKVTHVYTGIPYKWLATAAFPVVIDPDYATSGDATILGTGYMASYSTARNTSASAVTSGATTGLIGQTYEWF